MVDAYDNLESQVDRQAVLAGMAHGWANETSGQDELRLPKDYQSTNEIVDDSKRAHRLQLG